jgi:hypothetical protein
MLAANPFAARPWGARQHRTWLDKAPTADSLAAINDPGGCCEEWRCHSSFFVDRIVRGTTRVIC